MSNTIKKIRINDEKNADIIEETTRDNSYDSAIELRFNNELVLIFGKTYVNIGYVTEIETLQDGDIFLGWRIKILQPLGIRIVNIYSTWDLKILKKMVESDRAFAERLDKERIQWLDED